MDKECKVCGTWLSITEDAEVCWRCMEKNNELKRIVSAIKVLSELCMIEHTGKPSESRMEELVKLGMLGADMLAEGLM